MYRIAGSRIARNNKVSLFMKTPACYRAFHIKNCVLSPSIRPVETSYDPSVVQPSSEETGFEIRSGPNTGGSFTTRPDNVEDTKPPEAPLPTHYLDTLKVFKELKEAGFTDLQATQIIKLTEDNLARNLTEVVQRYVPKSDLENENYLFHAASSELSVEVKRSRESHMNESRNGINLLDRELSSVTDELKDLMINCKNDSEVAVNDHKADNALLSKQLSIQIREVENRINSQLISEVKFGVENLRWSLTRRGIFCILSVAASVLIAVTGNKIFSQLTSEAETISEVEERIGALEDSGFNEVGLDDGKTPHTHLK